MRSLEHAVGSGYAAAVVFVVQRNDVVSFATNDDADPEFAQVFREALAKGVQAYAYKCDISESAITLSSPLPIRI